MEYLNLHIQVTPQLYLILANISFVDEVLKPGRLNCAVGKELSSFASLIARKSTCVHQILIKLLYDKQTFFGSFSGEC